MPTERRRAAILSTDIVGYSRLMAEDEDETVRRLGAYRTEITNLVTEHRGLCAAHFTEGRLEEPRSCFLCARPDSLP
jgi:class 3 adenylate cyclase